MICFLIFLPQNIIFCSIYITFIPLYITSDEASFWAVLIHCPSSTSHCLLMFPAGVCGHLQIAAISHTSDIRHSMTGLVTAISGTCNWKIIFHGMSPGWVFGSQVRVPTSSVKWPLKVSKIITPLFFRRTPDILSQNSLSHVPMISSVINPFMLDWSIH